MFEVTYKIDGVKAVLSNVSDFTIAREGDGPMMVLIYRRDKCTGFNIEQLEYLRGREVTHISNLVVKSAENILRTEMPNDGHHRRIKEDAQVLAGDEYGYLEYIGADSATIWLHPMMDKPFCTVKDGQIRFL